MKSATTKRKDPFEKERALVRAGKNVKTEAPTPSTVVDPSFAILLLNALKGEIGPLLESIRGENGHTPAKGVDYWTDADIKDLIERLKPLIPKPIPGKDAVVDYKAIYMQMEKMFAKLPKPKNGEPGKDAVVDYERVVKAVIAKLPPVQAEAVDYKRLEELVEQKVRSRVADIHAQRPVTGSANSIKSLVDVVIDGLDQDERGNYILTSPTPGGGSISKETPVGAIDNSNTTFTVDNEPLYININGAIYEEGDGEYASYSAGTITLANPVGTGGFIKSYY